MAKKKVTPEQVEAAERQLMLLTRFKASGEIIKSKRCTRRILAYRHTQIECKELCLTSHKTHR